MVERKYSYTRKKWATKFILENLKFLGNLTLLRHTDRIAIFCDDYQCPLVNKIRILIRTGEDSAVMTIDHEVVCCWLAGAGDKAWESLYSEANFIIQRVSFIDSSYIGCVGNKSLLLLDS